MSKSKKSSKVKILIGSVFKPVSDTRMFERFAISLSETGLYKVFIVGNKGKYINLYKDIKFKILYNYHKYSFWRIFAPIQFFLYCFKVNPALIIVCTPELLTAAVAYKMIFGAKIIYDIEQNYSGKFLQAKSNFYFKHLVAGFTYMVELASKPFVNMYFISTPEIAHIKHLPLQNAVLLQNKYKKMEYYDDVLPKGIEENKDEKVKILVCQPFNDKADIEKIANTLSKLKSIKKSIYAVFCNVEYNNFLYRLMKKYVKKHRYFKLKGLNNVLNHKELHIQIQKSNYVILYYDGIYKNYITSLMYECLALKVPVIHNFNDDLSKIIVEYHGGVYYDFDAQNVNELTQKLENGVFFDTNSNMYELTWESEQHKLIHTIEEVVRKIT